MDILIAVIFFGVLQTVCTVSQHRWRWAGLSAGLLGAFVCYALHPWVSQINYERLNTALASPGAVSALAAVLLIEALAKVLERFHEPRAPTEGGNVWFSVRRVTINASCALLRFLPPISLLFAVFYAQAYAFHTIERLPFARLSLLIAASFALLVALGSLALRRAVCAETRELLEYRLLFLQLVVALVLPVVGRLGYSTPIYHGYGIYLSFAGFVTLAALLAGLGFLVTRRLLRRHSTFR